MREKPSVSATTLSPAYLQQRASKRVRMQQPTYQIRRGRRDKGREHKAPGENRPVDLLDDCINVSRSPLRLRLHQNAQDES
jgi:hypothetical protein